MKNIDYCITPNITPEEYMHMREVVGWGLFPLEEAEAGLKNSYIWCLREKGCVSNPPIGLARVIWDQLKPGYKFMVSLASAKGKEDFYKKFGFIARPDEDHGPGMHQWFTAES